ncbi:hypothetical protein ACWGHA_20495 [Streptomyces xanthophaeus]
MDQRTRERLPVLPLLVRTAQERLTTASRRLHATCSVEPGQDFNVDCRPWHRPVLARNRQRGALVWAVDPDTGNRRDLATGSDLVTAGHENVETTMRYKAVYPEEAIEAYRAFIARRRSERPSAEYRTPTEAEWDDFLAHFEKRNVPSASVPAPFQRLVFTSTPVSDVHSFGRIRHSATALKRSATTCATGSPRLSAKAGSARSKDFR